MKKFKVYGNTVVTVTKEVWANNEDEAMEKAANQLYSLNCYCGNGGYDKLIGVEGYDEAIDVGGCIEWDYTEVLEDDPDYFECPDCEAECEVCESDDGFRYYHCPDCDQYYDEDGDEFYPDVEEEEA